ncbi:MAG: NAD(P)/FAD-dependent oxidoreductase [Deltaproteobacteria bacterium]|nr:MAG: NAD(P)/FAD-dependent oxidoreductase [Deltaproteobacteria bacterium]
MKELLILGAGTGGSLIANKLVRSLPDGWRVTVVDRDDKHIYQPGLLFLPFGDLRPEDLVRPRRKLLDPSVRVVLAGIDRIDPENKVVALDDGTQLTWDLLIVSTGTRVRPDQTPGMTGRYWRQDVHEFYTLEGATALAHRLEGFTGGRLVVDVADMPIKCPVAPLEFAFLADAYLQKRGLRDKTELVFVTPLDGAFTKPVASRALGGMLEQRGIHTVTNFSLSDVLEDEKAIQSYDGRKVDFDLLVSVPLHGGSSAVHDSGIGDDMGFLPTDKHTLQSRDYDHIFAIGDATDLPISKAGAVAHFQGDVLHDNVMRWIEERPLWAGYDGHANCFIETGHGKAMLIDFNYETEPLPGKFPLPGIGPFTLLAESELNHWGKLAFKWAYWNVLVRGDDLPMDHRMLMYGKRSA